LGLVIGLITSGRSGAVPNSSQPRPMSSAEAAGSRPEKNRGSQ
jgi:hypothetical protein